MMDAAEAERAGLVSRVVPADKLLDEALAAAAQIAGVLAAGGDDGQGIGQPRLRVAARRGHAVRAARCSTRCSRPRTRRKAWPPSSRSASRSSGTSELQGSAVRWR